MDYFAVARGITHEEAYATPRRLPVPEEASAVIPLSPSAIRWAIAFPQRGGQP
jgi:hypothetical protein